MALPLSNAAEDDDEEELVHGYAQLPADHLSDSSESSNNGTSCDLAYDTLSTEIQAATRNKDINDGSSYQNGGHVAHMDGLKSQAATEPAVLGSSHQNVDHFTPSNGSVVHVDGMEIHVYGDLAGLETFAHPLNNCDDGKNINNEDDVGESERQHAEDAAFQRAKEADDARRLAPLPPDRCQAIKKAMQNISFGGFQPEWAGRVPEEQWVNRLRVKLMSKSIKY